MTGWQTLITAAAAAIVAGCWLAIRAAVANAVIEQGRHWQLDATSEPGIFDDLMALADATTETEYDGRHRSESEPDLLGDLMAFANATSETDYAGRHGQVERPATFDQNEVEPVGVDW